MRTPLTTASTRPSSRVNRRRMRSASPSGRELRTTARAFSLRTVSPAFARRERDDARDAAEVRALARRAVRGRPREQRPHGGGLPRADLDGQHAAGAQAAPAPGDEPAIDVEPVVAAVEREARLVVAHVGLERLVLGRRDVRRVADDEVEALLRRQRRRRGRCAGRRQRPPRPRRAALRRATSTAPSRRRRPRRATNGFSAASARAMQPEPVPTSRASGSGRRPRPAADRQRLERHVDQRLGLGPRDEHVGRDLELERAKGAPAADVGDRLARLATARGSPRSARSSIARELALRTAPKSSARSTPSAVASSSSASSRGERDPLARSRARGRAERLAHARRGGHRHSPPAAASCLRRSSAASASVNSSSSPSITSARRWLVSPMRWSLTRFCWKL